MKRSTRKCCCAILTDEGLILENLAAHWVLSLFFLRRVRLLSLLLLLVACFNTCDIRVVGTVFIYNWSTNRPQTHIIITYVWARRTRFHILCYGDDGDRQYTLMNNNKSWAMCFGRVDAKKRGYRNLIHMWQNRAFCALYLISEWSLAA